MTCDKNPVVDLYASAGRWYDQQEQVDRQRYEAWLLSMGVRIVAQEVAAERFSDDLSRKYFAEGFSGVHATVSNPRAAGMEQVFRAGRRAKEEKGMAQRFHACAATLRSTMGYSFEDWLDIAYQCKPTPWRQSFKG